MEYFRIPPIVGEVDYSNNRFIVIFVTKENCIISLKLMKQGGEHQIDCKAGNTIRLDIELDKSLNSEIIKYYIDDVQVFVNHIGLNGARLITFVSCDYPELDIKRSLWNSIQFYSPDICYHIGDNIYGDVPYKKGKNIIEEHEHKQDKRKNKGKYPVSLPLDEVRARYKERYEKTWKRWGLKLNNTSHVAIWDDHDVTEGFNALDINNSITETACEVYSEYQESTRLDQGEHKCVYRHKINDRCYVLLIDRMYVETVFSVQLKMLVDDYINDIEDGTIILAFTSAPIPSIEGKRKKVYEKIFGDDALWKKEDLISLYDMIFAWMGDDTKKNAAIIGGDIHIGISGEVLKNNRKIPFYVTSPISNHPTIIERIYAGGYQLGTRMEVGKYDVYINQCKCKRNYLLAEVDNSGKFKGTLVFARKSLPKNILALPREGLKLII